MSDDNFLDGNHALLMGMIGGALMKAGLDTELQVDDEGDYLPYVIVTRPSGRWKISVDPLG